MRFFIFFIFLSLPAYASVGFNFESVRTSDDLRLRGVSAESDQLVLIKAESQQLDFNSQIERIHTLSLGHQWMKENHSVEAHFKLVDLDHENKHRIRGLGSLGYIFSDDSLYLRASLRQYLPAQTLSVQQAEFVGLREDELSVQLYWLPFKKFKLQTSQSLGWRSDANRKYNSDYALMYGLSPGWPWIWVGYGYYTLTFSEKKLGYWNPKDFSSHGFRVDSSFQLYSKLSAIFAVNFNNYNEDGFKGNGHYGVAGLQWGNSSESYLKATWTQIRSGQSNSPWKYDGLNLGLFIAY